MHTRHLSLLAGGAMALAAVPLAACGGHADQAAATRTADSVAAVSRGVDVAGAGSIGKLTARAGVVTNAPVHTPGAPVIRTIDGGITLALANDTVSMGLSDSLLASARKDMAKTDTGALSGALSSFIKRTVSSALQSRVAYPVEDIARASYENGVIRFDYAQKRQMTFDNVSSKHKQALASFAPADAQRFVAAVDSAIVARKAGQ